MMVRIREFENQAIEAAKANLTRTAIHTYNGEEAIAAGVCANLKKEDLITSTHRGHGHCIAKGADIKKMYAELMAKKTGYCKGKGGSMHIADLSTGNIGANGIVGGSIPIATGAALGLKLKRSKNVVVCFFGEGASNEGSFHESINLASVWKLPVIFVCENNKYGISTHISKTMNIKQISVRAKAYGIEGITLDGNNVAEVYKEMAIIIDKVRNGLGPILVEMDTYRMSGHYYGDNECYRTKDEVALWKEKDPLILCSKLLVNYYGMHNNEIETMIKEEHLKVVEAFDKALLEPDPKRSEIMDDLYDPVFETIKWQ
jgi:pyruvate dehydrogenase E1 component alpha subunit